MWVADKTITVIAASLNRNRLLLTLLFLLSTGIPFAGAGEKPIYLRAQHINMDQRTGLSTYHGKVRLRRGELSFSADRAIVKQNNSNIESLTAFGNPVVVRKRNLEDNSLTTVNGRRLVYTATSNTVIVTGKAIIRKGRDIIKSEKVIYRIDDDHIVAESADKSGRVKAVLQINRRSRRTTNPGQ
jgi:lipopolysaccharide transport protein LptA